MLTGNQWSSLVNHARSKIDHYYDPASIFAEQQDLRLQLEIKHKGVYIGFDDSRGNPILREGFLKDGLLNILQTTEQVVDNVYSMLRKESIPISKVHTGTFHFTIVTDVTYLPNPTAWNENRDGVYFMWGQDYRALYLPYQIRKMNLSKIEILDRLCSWEAGVAANLWRLPEGLVWKLTCHSHSS